MEADEGELDEEEALVAKPLRSPTAPTAAERAAHAPNHLPIAPGASTVLQAAAITRVTKQWSAATTAYQKSLWIIVTCDERTKKRTSR